MLELKELAEKRESVKLEKTQELANDKYQNQRLRELNVSMLYNPRYIEERERYITNLNVLRVSYSHRY